MLLLAAISLLLCNCSTFAATVMQFYTFGYNEPGCLGLGDVVERTTPTLLVPPVSPSGSPYNKIQFVGFVGYLSSIQFDFVIFGENGAGQLGLGDYTPRLTPTSPMEGPLMTASIIRVAASQFHTIALAADGRIFTMGENTYGQLGIPDGIERVTPTLLSGNVDETLVRFAGAGHYHSVFTGRGFTYTCGYSNEGQLGLGDDLSRKTVTVLRGNLTSVSIVQVTCGEHHSIALTRQGRVFAWGLNSLGQLGQGQNDTTDRYTPSLMSFALSTVSVVFVEGGGGYRTFALDAFGTLYGCGENSDTTPGLGLGDGVSRGTPTLLMASLGSVVSVSNGNGHSLVLSLLNSQLGLYSFGDGDYGRLGVGDTVPRATPTLLSQFQGEGINIVGISAGFLQSAVTVMLSIAPNSSQQTPAPAPPPPFVKPHPNPMYLPAVDPLLSSGSTCSASAVSLVLALLVLLLS